MGSMPEPPPMLVDMSGLKMLGCHADFCTVSKCRIRGESEDHSSEKACKGSILDLRDLRTKRTYVLQKFLKRKVSNEP